MDHEPLGPRAASFETGFLRDVHREIDLALRDLDRAWLARGKDRLRRLEEDLLAQIRWEHGS